MQLRHDTQSPITDCGIPDGTLSPVTVHPLEPIEPEDKQTTADLIALFKRSKMEEKGPKKSQPASPQSQNMEEKEPEESKPTPPQSQNMEESGTLNYIGNMALLGALAGVSSTIVAPLLFEMSRKGCCHPFSCENTTGERQDLGEVAALTIGAVPGLVCGFFGGTVGVLSAPFVTPEIKNRIHHWLHR